MKKSAIDFSVQKRVRRPWRKYLDSLEPHRPDLHRYCCALTGNVWDGEDLVQDVLLRVFGLLGKVDTDLKNPRAYLIRTASHLWIDRTRREELHRKFLKEPAHEEETVTQPQIKDGGAVTSAINALFETLAPQERAAILIKDVFDFSIAETAVLLKTTQGAVKSALHRGRGELRRTALPLHRTNGATSELVEDFRKALSNKDIEKLRSMCLEEVTIELVGGATIDSFEQGKVFFEHAHTVFPALGFGSNPWWKTVEFQGETIVLGFRTLNETEGLNEIHRLEEQDGRISTVRCYCFCPNTLHTVASQLGLRALERPYRSPSLGVAIKSLAKAGIAKMTGWGRR